MINRKELIKKYLEFFKSKDHKIISSASLIPENDPTVLFTTAGMHPLVPFLLGQLHPLGKRICNVQKCIRTGDIDEVGNETHHTFFEMLGNWSFGDYFKKEAIEYSFEFLTKTLKIPIERLAVSVFEGDNDAPRDDEAAKVWQSLGIAKERIAFLAKKDNWWGPAGSTGPCGPDTEMFYWKDNTTQAPQKFNPKDKRWVEIWNDVLMQYNKNKKGNYEDASQKNIDTGMGVERTIAILNGLEDNYLSGCFKPIIEQIEHLSNKEYKNHKKEMRIIADHLKASVFLIADGVIPSNTEQGYVLRRLIRRTIMNLRRLEFIGTNLLWPIAKEVFKIYEDYKELKINKSKIMRELEKEEEKFNLTLEKGLKVFEKIISNKKEISGKKAFLLFQSYGFPIEMTKELAKEKGYNVNVKDFEEELQKHQELSRTASAGKFRSGLADNSVATTKLHTATHLLLAALKIVLKNPNITQKGSNITPERLRFDFAYNRKLTKEELTEIEDLVNAQIQKSCEVAREEMHPTKAKDEGAAGVFEAKYGEVVSVYTIDDFSKEICTGPHVKNTCEIGHFKIKKEESSSAGVRRIKAVLD